MAVDVTAGFNPATMAIEAHCDACGELVATMDRRLQSESRYLSTYWFGLLHNGRRNHQEACRGHRVE